MLISFICEKTASHALSNQCVKLEPQVLEEANELRATLLDPHQGVEPHGIRRYEFVQHDERRLGVRAGRKKLRHLRFAQVPR
jgi:hypothetical protein